MNSQVRVRAVSTTLILVGLMLTYIALPSDSTVNIFAVAAVGVGLSLSIAIAIEATSGVRSLIRVDILMFAVLYGLTFLEFLFPQSNIDTVVSPATATSGTLAAFLGFAGLAIGRHLVPWRNKSEVAAYTDVPPRQIFRLFVLAALVGYLHILLAVHFDPLEMLRQMALPRFWQSWSRARYGGDWYTLLVEVGALIYLIPPLSGLIYARARDFGTSQKIIVTIVILVTFYYGFTTGTRNILAVYVITFFGAYFLNREKISVWRVGLQGAAILALLLFVTSYMLEFRNVGISNFSFSDRSRDTLFIDNNMVVISQLTNAFPNQYDFLGFEIPYHAVIHPIPRALWPEKPEGLSVTVESIAGTTQATISSTFIGEAYMTRGMLGVILAGILLGAAGEMWNRVGRNTNSPFAQLLYVSGFFCAAITMRSILWMSVTMLPTIALWLYGRLWLSRTALRARTR